MTIERYFQGRVWSGEALKSLGGDLHVLEKNSLSSGMGLLYTVVPSQAGMGMLGWGTFL